MILRGRALTSEARALPTTPMVPPMMPMRRIARCGGAVGLVAALALGLAACGLFASNGPTTITDTSAHNLTVVVVASSTAARPQVAADVTLSILFQTADGHSVQLVRGESVTCGDVLLMNDSSSFDGTLPALPDGAQITCTYTRAGTATAIHFALPTRPTITEPSADASIARSHNQTIYYSDAPYSTERSCQVYAYGYTGEHTSQVGGAGLPDGSVLQLDTSGLQAGAGSVMLYRQCANVPLGGTAFRAALLNASSAVQLPVTWT